MTLKNKLEQLTTEFTKLKDKILAKLTLKDNNLQSEKANHQETIRKLEITLKDNASNEQILEQLLTEFQSLTTSLDND